MVWHMSWFHLNVTRSKDTHICKHIYTQTTLQESLLDLLVIQRYTHTCAHAHACQNTMWTAQTEHWWEQTLHYHTHSIHYIANFSLSPYFNFFIHVLFLSFPFLYFLLSLSFSHLCSLFQWHFLYFMFFQPDSSPDGSTHLHNEFELD